MDLCWLMGSGETGTDMKSVNFTKNGAKRHQYGGHLVRMEEEKLSRKVLEG